MVNALRRAVRIVRNVIQSPITGRKRFGTGKTLIGLLITIAILLPKGDTLMLRQSEWAAAEYRFDLMGWELANFPAKWVQRVKDVLPWAANGTGSRKDQLNRYIELSSMIRDTVEDLASMPFHPTLDSEERSDIQDSLARLKSERKSLRNGVEELVESIVSSVLVKEDLTAIGPLIWPPVDVRFDFAPNVLVTSPRDHIERLDSILLDPDIPVTAIEHIENSLQEQSNLSGIVIQVGGVATYPTVIPPGGDLKRLLELTAHEWLHTHFFFHPFGQALFSDAEMFTLNETLANLFGREVALSAHESLVATLLPEAITRDHRENVPESEGLDFDQFMQDTRHLVDKSLNDGDVVGAESLMEDRRITLNARGFNIRKINQAWFAFYGTYADSPASVSTIDTELEELRSLVPTLGHLIRMLRGVSSYDMFLELLDRHSEEFNRK